jgi:hypothetical protein
MTKELEGTAFFPLSEAQTRQQIDADAAWRAYRDALRAAQDVRGSMLWRVQGERKYLIRVSTSGAQTSLGPESAENMQIYARFISRKATVEDRVAQLKATVAQHQRLNKALRVGRVPTVVVDTLNALSKAKLQDHFLTVGTHAIYAYESACGVRVQPEATATQDIDLLLDTRKLLTFITTMERLDTSLLGIFQKVDKTFALLSEQKYTAVNATGFEIDVIRRLAHTPAGADPHPLKVSAFEDDFWAAQVATGQALLDGGRFTHMVVSTSGHMATMHVPAPETFVRIKTQLGKSPQRDPLKARKDLLQASVVQALIDDHGLAHVARAQSSRSAA